MSEKTEALRLADRLESDFVRSQTMLDAAAELRRLVAEVERLSLDSIHSCHAECQRPVCRLARERDALLEALQDLMHQYKDQPECFMDWSKARAAIKAVEENT